MITGVYYVQYAQGSVLYCSQHTTFEYHWN